MGVGGYDSRSRTFRAGLKALRVGFCLGLFTACTSPDDEDTDPVQDTDQDTGVAATGTKHPIYVMFKAHGHNYGFNAPMEDPAQWMLIKKNKYGERKAEVEWLRDEAEAYGMKMSFQLNGEYCRDARVLMQDDTSHIRELVTRGHSVGTHFHPYAFTGENEFWMHYDNNEVTPEVMESIWRTQIDEVALALGGSFRRIDPAGPRSTDELQALFQELILEYGFDILPAGEVFTYTEWEHKPWTPFRQLHPTPLIEDPEGDWVGVTSIGQIGLVIPQGKHATSLGVGQIKRRFMMAYAQWLHMRLSGGPERIFQFGMMTHPDQNADYRDQVTELMRFFGEEVSSWKGPDGGPVVALVTDEELVDAFYEWEEENPGTSSFSFDYEAHSEGEAQPYPYALEGITVGLKDAEMEGKVEALSTDEVQVFGLRYREIFRQPQPTQEPPERITGIGDLTEAVYLVTSVNATTVDLSSLLNGTVYVKAGDTGVVTSADPAAIEVGVVPVLVSVTNAMFEALIVGSRWVDARCVSCRKAGLRRSLAAVARPSGGVPVGLWHSDYETASNVASKIASDRLNHGLRCISRGTAAAWISCK